MSDAETLIEYVRRKDLSGLEQAITSSSSSSSRLDIDSQDDDGRTVLHHAVLQAAEDNDLTIVRLLIASGASVSIKDETGKRETCLHISVRLRKIELTRLILESPTFDVTNCDALYPCRLLSKCCLIEDVHPFAAEDSDSTLAKRKSFGEQRFISVRLNTHKCIDGLFSLEREYVRDFIVIQDYALPPLREVLRRLDHEALSTLCIVDCPLIRNEDFENDIFRGLQLTTLVLCRVQLRRVPESVLEMQSSLQVLKLDGNHLGEVPAMIGNLENLQTLTFDSQTPRLRTVPESIGRLQQLKVLSFSYNRIDYITWVVKLSSLVVLRCSRNRISSLPDGLMDLRRLKVLDVSHNRLETIPCCLFGLVSRLTRFDFFNLTMKPRVTRRDRGELLAHMELELFLRQRPPSPVSTPPSSSHGVSSGGEKYRRYMSVALVGESQSGRRTLMAALKDEKGICRHDDKGHDPVCYETDQFDVIDDGGDVASTHVGTLVLANDVLDPYCRSVVVDLYVLLVDLTSLERHNGSQHLFARHVSRLQTWLQALHELSPDTPVLIVGTHAEQVKYMSFAEIWLILEELLERGRSNHARRYGDSRCQACLLCCHRSLAIRHSITPKSRASAGFVDISLPTSETPVLNGYASLTAASAAGDDRSTVTGGGTCRYPHVVGYYEVDSRKHFPKDGRKTNTCIDQLKVGIVRLINATARSPKIPTKWILFVRHLATIRCQAPALPCILYEEVVSIARSFDIAETRVPLMLRYFHQRGRLLFLDRDPTLSRLVVLNPAWFVQTIGRVLDDMDGCRAETASILHALSDKDVDRQLQKASGSTPSLCYSSRWVLAALQRLEVCVALRSGPSPTQFLFPSLLEAGQPSQDVWPDVPEWDEKQITCDFAIRALNPGFFTDLVVSLIREGGRLLEVVPDPAPVFLSRHTVFFTGVDVGGCDGCHEIRRRLNSADYADDDVKDDANGCVIVPDDVIHKVHIAVEGNMATIRVHVRGVSPCCALKAVLRFIELFFEDLPDDWSDALSSSDRSSAVGSEVKDAGSNASSADVTSSSGGGGVVSEEVDRQLFLLCPKCVLLHHTRPEHIVMHNQPMRRRAICGRWHNLGSWAKALTGGYQFASVDLLFSNVLASLPDYEHPRLVLLLPPSASVCSREWYLGLRMRFLEGFEVHFLCENPTFWHMTDASGYRLTRSTRFVKRVGNHISSLFGLTLPLIQVVQGVNELHQNARLFAPVAEDLIQVYDYLRNFDNHYLDDPYTWLLRNKDRVVTMLTKSLASVSDGIPDLFFKAGSSLSADDLFQTNSFRASRTQLAKYLRLESNSGRFGALRPIYIGREIRWVCDAHFDELRSMPNGQ